MQGDGFVFINKRGVLKTAISAEKIDNLATWTSKYGSITFNHVGYDLPSGGINEAGLVVETLAVDKAEYPVPEERPIIDGSQLTQYQLDNFSRIEQVIASVSQFRIKSLTPEDLLSHSLVCDKTGTCAVIEFLGGKIVHYTNKSMPINVLTNNTYAESVESWKSGKLPAIDIWRSLERFTQATNMVKNYDPKGSVSAVDYAFDIL